MKEKLINMKVWQKVLLGLVIIMVLAVACTPNDSQEEVVRDEPMETEKSAEEVEVVEKEEVVIQKETKQKELSKDELQYLQYTMSHSNDLSSQFFQFSELMSNPVDGQEWVMDVVIVIARIQELADEHIEYRDIPELFRGVDKEYKQAMVLYSNSMENMPSALDKVFDYNDDSELVVEMANMQEATEHVQTATEMIEEITVEYNQQK